MAKENSTYTLKVSTSEIESSLDDYSGTFDVEIDAVNNQANETQQLAPMRLDFVEVLEERKVINNVEAIEGELIVGFKKDTIVNIDIDGSLVITDEYADCFSINDQGELIFER